VNRIHVNGSPMEVPAGWRLADLLLDLDLTNRRVAVELNGEIVPRSGHERTALAGGDRIEIVAAVGGG
jgi:sulfur carrier protein